MLAEESGLNQIYNVGCGLEYSLNDLIKLLKENIILHRPKFNFEVNYGPERKGDVISSRASIKKIKKNLNYSIQTGLEEGIKNLVNKYINE